MQRSPFVLGLASVFAGLTAVLAIAAVVGGQPVALVAAAPLAATSFVMYYHGSGKLARAMNRRERRDARRRAAQGDGRGGFGAGPRARGGPRTRAEREARFGGQRRRQRRHRPNGAATGTDGGGPRASPASGGPTRAEAREVLGVGPGADRGEIRRAYREKVKEVHPDRDGDEEAFKRVTAAYDRLRE